MTLKEIINCGIGLAMALFTTQESPDDVLRRFGYVASFTKHGLIEEAISLANEILGSDGDLNLVPAWKVSEIPDGGIVVFWVVGKNLTSSLNDMIFVTDYCRCIIVQEPILSQWMERYRSRLESLSEPHVLAYFLLHEAGHVHHKHPGRGVSASGSEYNAEDTVSKEREKDADAFAADAIRQASGDTSDFDRSIAAGWTHIAISSLAFAISSGRVIDSFGGSVLNQPSLFLDDGASHPNFELRILLINDRIQSTEVSRELLESFIQHRNAAGTRARNPLFKKAQ